MLTFPINHWSGSSIPINSLRFSSKDANRLTRTPSVAGNRNLWTWAGWIKRGQLSVGQNITTFDTAAVSDGVRFNATDQLNVSIAGTVRLMSTQVFRDPAAWMHIVVAFDAANAVAANKLRVYVNGVEITTWTTDTRAAIAVNTAKTNTLVQHVIGANTVGGVPFDGYLADIYMIDGAALAPTAFGSFDADGIWQPGPQYAGAYGTNGCFLDTAEVVGGSSLLDSGPNGLTWAPVNFNFTATSYNFHGSYDSPVDTYCVLDSADRTGSTVSGGGLDITNATTNPSVCASTYFVDKGKWYWEATATNATAGSFAGIISNFATVGAGRLDFPGRDANGYSLRFSSGNKVTANATGAGLAYGTPVTAGDTVMVAFDADNGKIWWGKNGTWFASGDPAAGTGEAFSGIVVGNGRDWSPAHGNNAAGGTTSYNFGQRDFKYVPPAGFGKLRASSLVPVSILNGEVAVDAKLYVGNGTGQSITGLAFQPDLVHILSRAAQVRQATFVDSARGTGKSFTLSNNSAELAENSVTAFNADGFTLGNSANVSTNARNYTSAAWKKGAAYGFDVVTYTGNGVSGRKLAHNCGGVPEFIMIKRRDAAGATIWYHKFGGYPANAPQNGAWRVYESDSTNNFSPAWAVGAGFWNSTAPDAAEITLGNDTEVNANGGTYVAYIWRSVEGFSKFGLYTGTGTANGVTAFCGFAPQVHWCANAAGTPYQVYHDDARNTKNGDGYRSLWYGASVAEQTTHDVDLVSNGFRQRVASVYANAASDNICYAAFGKHPFKHGRAR